MLWVALATAIMLLSGELSREADDGAILAALIAALRKATIQEVPDAPRRAAALRALTTFEAGLTAYRRQLVTFKACIAAADSKYGAVQADYDACSGPLVSERASLRASLAMLSSGARAADTATGRGGMCARGPHAHTSTSPARAARRRLDRKTMPHCALGALVVTIRQGGPAPLPGYRAKFNWRANAQAASGYV